MEKIQQNKNLVPSWGKQNSFLSHPPLPQTLQKHLKNPKSSSCLK